MNFMRIILQQDDFCEGEKVSELFKKHFSLGEMLRLMGKWWSDVTTIWKGRNGKCRKSYLQLLSRTENLNPTHVPLTIKKNGKTFSCKLLELELQLDVNPSV